MKKSDVRKQLRKKNIFIIFLVVVLLISVSQIFNTYSKFYSEIAGNGSATVAKWAFKVNGQEEILSTIFLADTIPEEDATKLTKGKIAPGTSGSFDIKIDATGCETALNYVVSFGEVTGGNLPRNLIFKVDGNKYNLADGFTGTIYANASDKVITKTVVWEWPFDSDEDEDSIEQDLIDTEDGQTLTPQFGFNIIITGMQVD